MDNSTGSSDSIRRTVYVSPSASPVSFWSSPWTVTAVIASVILFCSLFAILSTCIWKRWQRCSRTEKNSRVCSGCRCFSSGDRSPGSCQCPVGESGFTGSMSLTSIRQQLAVRRLSGGHGGYGCLREEQTADDDECSSPVESGRICSPDTNSTIDHNRQSMHPDQRAPLDFVWPSGAASTYASLPSETSKPDAAAAAAAAVAAQTSHMRPTVVAAIAMHRHRESSLLGGGAAATVGVASRHPYERLQEDDVHSIGDIRLPPLLPGRNEPPEIVFSRRTAL